MLLLLYIAIGVLGLGWPLNPALRWLFPKLGRRASAAISVVVLVALIVAAQKVVEYPRAPRPLRGWQREALTLNTPTIPPVPGRITFYMCAPEGALEAQDYSRELLNVFNVRNLSIAYGCDPAWGDIVVNQGKVIVAPSNDVFLRVRGIELWVLDPKHPPIAALQMARALRAAGIRSVWQADIRLAGIQIYDRYRVPINGPQCIVVVGAKPSWNWHVFTRTERQFLRFRSQHPPDPRWIMYQAMFIYAVLVFCAPLVSFLLWLC